MAGKKKQSKRSDDTDKKLSKRAPVKTSYKSGAEWTGNAKGRPKGSRNRLCQLYIEGLHEIFMEANEKGKTTGVQVLRDVAKDRPVAFMTAVGNLVPKDFQVNLGAGEGFKALWQALATGKLPQPTETDDDA